MKPRKQPGGQRAPYQQSEVYRFGNVLVDEWEGKVNAWPLDEGLIDYVEASIYGEGGGENLFRNANVIANPSLSIGGKDVDASKIDETLIRALHEIDEVEANVATGYHAIEFLLWGQDLNGTNAGAGARPWTDFAAGEACTGGNCDRRGDYLTAAIRLLISDLEEMTADWGPDGAARAGVMEGNPEQGLAKILIGMGSLSYGEMAGERIKLGLMLHDPEEEHDCFSDNTHNSHFYDVLGMRNVYIGAYRRIDGRIVQGPGLSDLIGAKDPALDREMRAGLEASLNAAGLIKAEADSGVMAYDQMLGEGNELGNSLIQSLVDALVGQTKSIERMVAALSIAGLEFEGSDSLDAPDRVFE